MSCLKQQWPNDLNTELRREGHDINIPPSGDQPKDFFDPTGRRGHYDTKW